MEELIKQAMAELENRRMQIENLLESFDNLDHVRSVYHQKYRENSSVFSGRGAVYTGIFGGYDSIVEPLVEDSLDYYLFTDTMPVNYAGKWKAVLVDNPQDYDSPTLTRLIKMHPWDYLPEYDWSVWVDGKVLIKSDLREFASIYGKKSGMLCFPHHRARSIDEEAKLIAACGKADISELEKQVTDYKEAGYVGRGYLIEAGCMIRSHHDELLKKVMDDWWKEFNSYKHNRDQMSFDYACWKNGYDFDICDLLAYGNPWISFVAVH